jgi:endonuclease VIII
MPEGDTIYRTARALRRALVGHRVTGFRSNYPLLTRLDEDSPLVGQTVDRVESRGKWVLIFLSAGHILATHMRMSGSWHIYRPGERWRQPGSNMRIVVENDKYLAVGFRIPVAQFHTTTSLSRDPRIPPAEADVLGQGFDFGAAALRIRAGDSQQIGETLLHQEVLSGVGNVYKSEICFVAGVNPFAPVSALTNTQIDLLVRTSHELVSANVLEDSPDTIATHRSPLRRTTRQSNPGENLWVYGRGGEPCRRCGEPVRMRLQGRHARVTFWCPQCQPLPNWAD